MELTTNIESSHDDHTKDTEGFIPVVGTDHGPKSESSGVLSRLPSRYSECREVVVRVEVECFADLLSGLITNAGHTKMKTVQPRSQLEEFRMEPLSPATE